MTEKEEKNMEMQVPELFQTEKRHRPGWGAGISGSDWESKVFEFVWEESDERTSKSQNKQEGGDF